MNHHRTTRRLGAAGFALALLLTSCGSSGGSDTSSDTSSDKGTTTAASSESGGGGSGDLKIEIKGFKFKPEDLEAKVGDTVTVTNEDGATHTATSTDAPSDFDTGDLKKGDSKEIKLDEAGTYEYDCDIHDYMKGTIEVS